MSKKQENKKELSPFARVVKESRKESNEYTQEKAAEILNVSARCFQNYEHDCGLPRLKRAMKMSLLFHFSLDALAAEMDEKGYLNDLD